MALKHKLRKRKRHCVRKDFEPDLVTFTLEGYPSFLVDALKLDSIFRKEAIQDKKDSLFSNITWEFVDLPTGLDPLVASGY